MARAPTSEQIDTYNRIKGSFKRIDQYTDSDLDAVIAVLGVELPEAYRYLNFIDCYMERRKRKLIAQDRVNRAIAAGEAKATAQLAKD